MCMITDNQAWKSPAANMWNINILPSCRHSVRHYVQSGIAMLTFALLMSARMGIFQETLYKQYGKHSKEALFYNVSVPPTGTTAEWRHLNLSVGRLQCNSACVFSTACLCPGSCSCPQTSTTTASSSIKAVSLNRMIIQYTKRKINLHVFSHTEIPDFCRRGEHILFGFFSAAPVLVPVVGLTMPIMWLYLLINVITQYPLISLPYVYWSVTEGPHIPTRLVAVSSFRIPARLTTFKQQLLQSRKALMWSKHRLVVWLRNIDSVYPTSPFQICFFYVIKKNPI